MSTGTPGRAGSSPPTTAPAAASRSTGAGWEDIDSDLERGWERFKGQSRLTWLEAKEAVRDGWRHVERALPGDFDRDGR